MTKMTHFSESCISQLHGNVHKKTRKFRYFIEGVIKRKIQKKIKTRLKQSMHKESKK